MDTLQGLPDVELTPRQQDCMDLVRKGLTSKQIARQLGISHRTVETHVAIVIEALQVNNRMAAVTRLEEIRRERERSHERDRPDPPFMLNHRDVGSDTYLMAFAGPPAKIAEPKEHGLPILPPLGGQPNAASASSRLAWIVRIGAFAIMTGCTVVLAISGASELATLAN